MNSFDGLMTKLLLTFYEVLIHHFKKRKKSCFKPKNVIYVFSNTVRSDRATMQSV